MPDPGVAHVDLHESRVARLARRRELDPPAGSRELTALREQVEEDLLQLLAVGAHGRRAARRRAAATTSVMLRAANCGCDQRLARSRARSSSGTATHVDSARAPPRCARRFSTSLISPSRCRWLRWMRSSASRCPAVTGPWMPISSSSRVAADRVERRAQLVAHHGEELALRAIGALRGDATPSARRDADARCPPPAPRGARAPWRVRDPFRRSDAPTPRR